MRLIGGNISDTPVKEIGDGSAFSVGGAEATATAPIIGDFGTPARLEATVPTIADHAGKQSHCKSIWKIKDNYYGFLFRDNGDSHKAYFMLLTINPATGVPTASTKVDLSAHHTSFNSQMFGVTMAASSTTATLVFHTYSAATSAVHEVTDCTVTFSTGALSSITNQTDAFSVTGAGGIKFVGMFKMSPTHVVVFEAYDDTETRVLAKGCKVASTRAFHSGTLLSVACSGAVSGVGVVGAYNEAGDDNTGVALTGKSGSSNQQAWKLSINTSTHAITEVGTAQLNGLTTYTTFASCNGATQNIGDNLYMQAVMKQMTRIDCSSATPAFTNVPEPHLLLVVPAHAGGSSDMVVLDNNRYMVAGHHGAASGDDILLSGVLYDHGASASLSIGDRGVGHDSEATVTLYGIMASSTAATAVTVIYKSDADSGNLRYYTVAIS